MDIQKKTVLRNEINLYALRATSVFQPISEDTVCYSNNAGCGHQSTTEKKDTSVSSSRQNVKEEGPQQGEKSMHAKHEAVADKLGLFT